MLRWITSVFLLLFAFISSNCLAKDSFSIALIEIPGVLEFDNSDTPYGRLVKKIFRRGNIKTEFYYVPSSRAYKMLGEDKVSCIFPVVPNLNTQQIDRSIISAPINAIGAYLFTLNSSKMPLKLESLENKIIVYRRGYLFGSILSYYPNVKFIPVASQQAAIGMLKKQRADALLDYLPDLKFVFSSETLNTLRYDLKLPVLYNSDRVQCVKNSNNIALINDVNSTIAHLRSNGELEKILGSYYLPIQKKTKLKDKIK